MSHKIAGRLILWACVFGGALALPGPAGAQDGGPGANEPNAGNTGSEEGGFANLVQDDGTIDFNHLDYNGRVERPESWTSVDWPWGGTTQFSATYDSYTTPAGETLIVPAPETFALMMLTVSDPDNPLNNASEAFRHTGFSQAYFQGDNVDLPSSGPGLTLNPDEFYQAIQNGALDEFSFMSWDLFWDIVDKSADADFLVAAMILLPFCEEQYGCDPASVEDVLAEGDLPLAPPPPRCPPPQIDFEDIWASTIAPAGDGGKVAPNFPIVIGQDEERRGVDVHARVTVPPVIHTWYEPIPRQVTECVFTPAGNGGNCTSSSTSDATRIGNPNYLQRTVVQYDCRQHVDIYPDFLANMDISLVLAQKSQNYINSHLNAVYPGAHVYQPAFRFSQPGPGGLIGGMNVTLEQFLENVPIQDPGLWLVIVSGTTTGTDVSTPRGFSIVLGDFYVGLVRIKLTE